ncbi:MAG: hypothetical protein ACK4SX_12115 [Alcanivoracaceae bacterium]
MLNLKVFRFSRARPLAGSTLFAMTPLALAAGGHFAVDDATITATGRCQLESWAGYTTSDDRSITLAPACNLTGNLELGLALTRSRLNDALVTDVELGAKTLLHDVDTVSVALSVTTGWQHGEDRLDGIDVALPVSLLLNERVTTHLNAGWGWLRDERDLALWGLAGDIQIAEPLHLIAESYGSDQGGTRVAVGLRYGLSLGNRELDLDIGWDRSRQSARDRVTTAGINIAF